MDIKTLYQYLMSRQAQSQNTPEGEPVPVQPLDQADAALAMAFMNDNIIEEKQALIEEIKPALS